MKVTALLTIFVLVGVALAILPNAQASVQPCPTYVGSGCCGTFAPCCSLVTCPPRALRCQEREVATTDLVEYLGPSARVATHNDCSVEACGDQGLPCCTVDGAMSRCRALAASSTVALPLPQPTVTVNPDGTITVTDTWTCPQGFENSPVNLVAGPVHIVNAQSCVPICRCRPIEATPASAPALCACPPPPDCKVPLADSTATAIPIPQVGAHVNRDCTVTVTETYDCPNGFVDGTLYYTAGPVHVVAGYCFIMCACMPMSAPARIDPFSSKVLA